MKKCSATIFGVLYFLLSSLAHAVVYNFTTSAYTIFVPDTGNAFSPGMYTSGYIVTSAPVPANLSYGDIANLITSYSFNDGLHSFTESNSAIHPTLVGGGFRVNTDSTGNITDAIVLIMSTVPANAVDSPVNYFSFGDGYHAYDRMNCITSVTDGLCDGIEFILGQSSRVVAQNLSISSSETSGTQNSIPTTPAWILGLLAGLIAVLGLAAFHRRSRTE